MEQKKKNQKTKKCCFAGKRLLKTLLCTSPFPKCHHNKKSPLLSEHKQSCLAAIRQFLGLRLKLLAKIQSFHTGSIWNGEQGDSQFDPVWLEGQGQGQGQASPMEPRSQRGTRVAHLVHALG